MLLPEAGQLEALCFDLARCRLAVRFAHLRSPRRLVLGWRLPGLGAGLLQLP
ncbi:MAG: hypothetical protein AB7K24_11215 [Gemmataceae bacterium]